jgi:hypothetical protein
MVNSLAKRIVGEIVADIESQCRPSYECLSDDEMTDLDEVISHGNEFADR